MTILRPEDKKTIEEAGVDVDTVFDRFIAVKCSHKVEEECKRLKEIEGINIELHERMDSIDCYWTLLEEHLLRYCPDLYANKEGLAWKGKEHGGRVYAHGDPIRESNLATRIYMVEYVPALISELKKSSLETLDKATYCLDVLITD